MAREGLEGALMDISQGAEEKNKLMSSVQEAMAQDLYDVESRDFPDVIKSLEKKLKASGRAESVTTAYLSGLEKGDPDVAAKVIDGLIDDALESRNQNELVQLLTDLRVITETRSAKPGTATSNRISSESAAIEGYKTREILLSQIKASVIEKVNRYVENGELPRSEANLVEDILFQEIVSLHNLEELRERVSNLEMADQTAQEYAAKILDSLASEPEVTAYFREFQSFEN